LRSEFWKLWQMLTAPQHQKRKEEKNFSILPRRLDGLRLGNVPSASHSVPCGPISSVETPSDGCQLSPTRYFSFPPWKLGGSGCQLVCTSRWFSSGCADPRPLLAVWRSLAVLRRSAHVPHRPKEPSSPAPPPAVRRGRAAELHKPTPGRCSAASPPAQYTGEELRKDFKKYQTSSLSHSCI
jgi:hypothetical protein